MFCILAGSIYLFIQLRLRNLQKAKVELENEVAVRTSQLREEKEKVETSGSEEAKYKADKASYKAKKKEGYVMKAHNRLINAISEEENSINKLGQEIKELEMESESESEML